MVSLVVSRESWVLFLVGPAKFGFLLLYFMLGGWVGGLGVGGVRGGVECFFELFSRYVLIAWLVQSPEKSEWPGS
jgi:hypothetical protein